MSGALLSSTQAARRLGVTAATVNRWADAGLLECARTAGRHRRFAPEVVDRFARAHASAAGRTAQPVEPGSLVDRLLDEPDHFALQAELLAQRARRGSWARVADWVGGALEELGDRWADGRIGVVEEHLASERLARALARCGEAIPVRRGGPRILLAVPEGEEHLLGLALVDVVLREGGWTPICSGRATPVGEVVRWLAAGAVEALALSASVASQADHLAHQAALLGGACRGAGVALVAGGRGPWPDPFPCGKLVRSFEHLRPWMEAVEAGMGAGVSPPA